MKNLSIRRSRAFTLVELLVVISIIAVLAGLAFPALNGALDNANRIKAVSNGKQVALAAIQAALDASSTGSYQYAWPLDMTTPPTTLTTYVTSCLIPGGYLTDMRMLAMQGIETGSTTNLTDKNVGFSMGMVGDNTDLTVPFLTTKNFDPTSRSLTASAKPFGDKGFVVVRRGGDASPYRKGQESIQASGAAAGTYIWGLDPTTASVTWQKTGQ